MRKSIHSIAAVTVIAALAMFHACSADPDVIEITEDQDLPEIVKSELDEDLIIEEILDDVLDDLEQFEFKKSESVCPVVTVEKPEDARYPKVVTRDFGDGCMNDIGVVKSGKVIVTLYGPWLAKGSVRTVEFVDYTHRGIKVEGKKVIECRGMNDDSLFVHTIEGKILLTKSDTIEIQRIIRKKRTMLTGFQEPGIPREWLIEGGTKVQDTEGARYEMHITEPLYHIQGCRWPQSGVKVVKFNPAEEESGDPDFKNKVVLDYSITGPEEKACDSFVLRTVDDNEPKEINLRKRN